MVTYDKFLFYLPYLGKLKKEVNEDSGEKVNPRNYESWRPKRATTEQQRGLQLEVLGGEKKKKLGSSRTSV